MCESKDIVGSSNFLYMVVRRVAILVNFARVMMVYDRVQFRERIKLIYTTNWSIRN